MSEEQSKGPEAKADPAPVHRVVMQKSELLERLEKVKTELEFLEMISKVMLKGYAGVAVEVCGTLVCHAIDLVSVAEEVQSA